MKVPNLQRRRSNEFLLKDKRLCAIVNFDSSLQERAVKYRNAQNPKLVDKTKKKNANKPLEEKKSKQSLKSEWILPDQVEAKKQVPKNVQLFLLELIKSRIVGSLNQQVVNNSQSFLPAPKIASEFN